MHTKCQNRRAFCTILRGTLRVWQTGAQPRPGRSLAVLTSRRLRKWPAVAGGCAWPMSGAGPRQASEDRACDGCGSGGTAKCCCPQQARARKKRQGALRLVMARVPLWREIPEPVATRLGPGPEWRMPARQRKAAQPVVRPVCSGGIATPAMICQRTAARSSALAEVAPGKLRTLMPPPAIHRSV